MSREPSIAHLNHNKLSHPPLRSCIRRARLLDLLGRIATCKLALLCAEAGYGKTTLILDFLSQWPYRVVWYRLDKSDRDVTQFILYLTEGIAQWIPGFGSELIRSVAHGVRMRSSVDLKSLLLHEMSTLEPVPLLLVLDNLETVAKSNEVCAFISDLLEYSGPDIHIIITSRSMPPLPIARLAARQEAFVLGPESLALTLEESRELLLSLRASCVTDAELQLLSQRIEGWAAGLVMVAEALRNSPQRDVMLSLEEFRGPPELVYRFFADEVFQEQSAALQDFLVKTSILRRLSHDDINDLLGVSNGGELLASLKGGGIFAHGLEASNEDLHYHPLFRAFLLQKLHARNSEEQIRDLYRRAIESARRRHQWHEAIEYCAAIVDWEHALEIVEQVGEELTRRGFLETVQHWLDLLPEEQILHRPMLLMLRGRLLRHAGRHHEALRDFGKALQCLDDRIDRELAVTIRVEVALAHNLAAEFQKAETVLQEALCLTGDNNVLKNRVLAELSGNCLGSDDLEQGAHWGEVAAEESIASGHHPMNTLSLIRALRFHGRALVLQGDYRRGIQGIERSIDLCRREDVGNLETGWSLFALGHSQVLRGDFGQGEAALDEAEAHASGCLPLLRWIWTWRGTSRRDRDAFDLAELDYSRAGDGALAEVAFLRLRQERHTEGLRLVEEALSRCTHPENLADGAECQAVYGIALAAVGSRRHALQRMKAAAESFAQRGRHQKLASIQWHLAGLLLEEGRETEAMQNLESAVLWACSLGVYHTKWWDPYLVARLWPLAFGAGWAPAYLMELARLRLGPEHCKFLYPALDKAPSVLRAQLVDTLTAVAGGSSAVRQFASDLLGNCNDLSARRHVGEALASGLLNLRDLARLRNDANLTWKEIEVLILYYLESHSDVADRRMRRRLAESLSLSEHTLKVHIRSIRSKLGLPEQQRGQNLSLSAIAHV